jgi:hypothetical protein
MSRPFFYLTNGSKLILVILQGLLQTLSEESLP